MNNYMVSIFLLIIVVIISQAIYVYTNKKIIEGWWWWNYNRDRNRANQRARAAAAARAARLAAEAARIRYLNLLSQFSNPRQTAYTNILGTLYVNNQTEENKKAYYEAKAIDDLEKEQTSCNNDQDVKKLIDLTAEMLSSDKQDSTKVYFLSQIIVKALDHIYKYDIQNNESQFNYISTQFTNTFNDDKNVKKKYFKIISLVSLAYIAKSTTSSSLSPGSDYFKKLAQPIIEESNTIIKELKKIDYKILSKEDEKILRNKNSVTVV